MAHNSPLHGSMAHNGTQHGTPWHIPGHSIASIVHSHRTWWYWCWTMATLKIYLGHWRHWKLILDIGGIGDWSWTLATLEINLGHWRHWRLILDIGDIMRNVSGLAISQPRSMRLWLKVRKAIEWEICHAWGFEICLRVWNMFEGCE